MLLQTLDSLGPQARFYGVTSAGRRQLAREKDAWDRMSGVIHTVLHGEA
jgi:hypothetical protein